jgi:hypothetical protein
VLLYFDWPVDSSTAFAHSNVPEIPAILFYSEGIRNQTINPAEFGLKTSPDFSQGFYASSA